MREDKNYTQALRVRRAHRVRAVIRGTEDRPRLSVSRSLKHIRVQVINDTIGKTIVSAGDTDVKETGTKTLVAAAVGKLIAERAKAAGVKVVVFDRGACRYHGRVKVLADAAREGGLEF